MRRIAVVVAVVSICAGVVRAQKQEMPKPGPEHQRLGVFVGNWTFEGEMKPGPMGPGGKLTGTDRIEWTPGNFFVQRSYQGTSPMGTMQGIEILADCVHRTANGRALLVTHGDQFDSVIACAPWLAHLGDHAYTLALRLNDAVARARGLFGLSYWSLSLWLKHKIKNAVQYIGRFEEAVARDVKARGLDGVVCGHIHHAAIRQFDGILYCNDGDWVESCTALVEDARGNLEILHWASAFVPRAAPARARIRKTAPLPA